MATAAPSSTASANPSVLLINPPSPPGLTANREGAGGLGAWSAGADGFLYPPQTLAYGAAILRVRGWDVHVLDAAGERLGEDETLQRAVQPGAPLVAVQVAALSLDNDIAFLNRLRALSPRARLLAIGASMALAGPILLERTDVDHVLVGEPEAVLPAACQAIAGAGSVRRLRRTLVPADLAAPGMDGEGRVADLDSLPHPAWDLIPRRRYGFLTLLGSRGCNDTCTFCPYVVGQGRRLRVRQAQAVVDEFHWLATTYQPARVIVRDPVFAAQHQRVEQICQGLIGMRSAARSMPAWECESRPEHFDRDLLRLLKRAGCTTIKLGFETTSESVLRAVQRIEPAGSAQEYMEETAAVVAACHSLGLACRLFVMTGLPGQSDQDIAETVSFLERVRPSAVHVKPFHRYPGLPMPGGESDEDRRRAERQAAAMQVAVAGIAPAQTLSLWQWARRWLRRRMQP